VIDAAAVAANVEDVHRRIERAGGSDVEIVAVTKTFPAEAIAAAVAAGCPAIGENYAQELVAKLADLDALGAGDAGVRPEVHFIGHLQSNKVRMLGPVVDVWETVDRTSLVRAIARVVPGARVLVQVNTSGEAQKSGCAPDEAPSLVAECRAQGLAVEGLMTIGPLAEPEAARPGFRLLRNLADDLGLRTCSMGMSADLEVAVEEGATHVRIGSALFGARAPGT
jgi:pyridoxal phosphate enzyme (YggS family)